MTFRQRRAVLVSSVVVCAAVLGGVFAFVGCGTHRHEGKAMNTTRISVDHVRLGTDKPFDEVTKAFEQQLGAVRPGSLQGTGRGRGRRGSQGRSRRWPGRAASCCSAPRPWLTAAPGRPEAEGGPVRRRQPAVRPPDDPTRHPSEPVCPVACPDLRNRRRQDLRGVR